MSKLQPASYSMGLDIDYYDDETGDRSGHAYGKIIVYDDGHVVLKVTNYGGPRSIELRPDEIEPVVELLTAAADHINETTKEN